jgi:hypothetical protein
MADGQMYGDPAGAQVVDPHDATYDVAPEVVEDENLPYGLAVIVNDGRSIWKEAIGLVSVLVVVRLGDVSIQVQDLLD